VTSTAAVAGQKLSATFLNNMRTGQLLTSSSGTTVASSTTETWVAMCVIPANDMAVGMVYRVEAWGLWSNTSTPTLNLRAKIGTSSTTPGSNGYGQLGATTTQSGVSNRLWTAKTQFTVESTGATASTFGYLKVKSAGFVAGTAPFLNDAVELTTGMDGTTTTTVDSTVINYFGITATWGTSSSSNTLTCRGFAAERLI